MKQQQIRNLAALLFVCARVFGAADIGLELLPRGERPFRLTFPDPREIRMALGFEGDSRIHATIGNYFSIFAIRPSVEPADWKIHFGLEGGGFFTMRQADRRFPLETADGLIGAYFDGRWGIWQGQLRFTHVSAHLADGSVATAIPYSRETLSLRAGVAPFNGAHFYTGLHYLANTIPRVHPWALQLGGTYFLSLGTTKLVPFTGFDLKFKEEADVNPTFNFQLGIALNNPPEAYRSFRFFYAYFTGVDPRGQFYNNVYTAHSLGIEMQI
jgi:hypothetical protein